MRGSLRILTTAFVLAAAFCTARGSQEQHAVWRTVKITCGECGEAGDVSIEAAVDDRAYKALKIVAFDREYALTEGELEKLKGFPLSSLSVTHETGYRVLGGYTVHVRFTRLDYDESRPSLKRTILISLARGRPGEATISTSQVKVAADAAELRGVTEEASDADDEDVKIVGRCRRIEPTGKRHQSYIFTFEIERVVAGRCDQKTAVFELYEDFGGRDLLATLRAKRLGEGDKEEFDKDVALTLTIQPIAPSDPIGKRYGVNARMANWSGGDTERRGRH